MKKSSQLVTVISGNEIHPVIGDSDDHQEHNESDEDDNEEYDESEEADYQEPNESDAEDC